MSSFEKTDVSRSPLLQPVMHRNYTSGLTSGAADPAPAAGPSPEPGPAPTPGPDAFAGNKPNFTPPPPGPTPGDTTRAFEFNEDTGSPSDLSEGDPGPGLSMPPGAARTFANTIGNMIQIYVPRAAYGYASIDMDSIIVYVERGMLRNNWIDTFKNINANTKEALQIPDETMKMWKAAFQHWLEYKSIQAANPTTELIIASGAILTEIGIKVYQCKKQNEGYVRQALEDANPEMRDQKINQPEKQEEDERRRAA